MINEMSIAAPSDWGQGLKNVKKAVKIFEESIEAVPELNMQKVIPSRSTIP